MTTKQNLVLFYAIRNQIEDFNEAEMKIDRFVNVLNNALSENENVIFRKFGSFEVRKTTERKIVNPKDSSKIIHAKPRKYVKFKISKTLEDNLCDKDAKGSNEEL